MNNCNFSLICLRHDNSLFSALLEADFKFDKGFFFEGSWFRTITIVASGRAHLTAGGDIKEIERRPSLL